ncbi:MAG: histidine kinase [Pseudomonadota bacterium]
MSSSESSIREVSRLNIPNLCTHYALLLALLLAQILITCGWLLGSVDLALESFALWTFYGQSLLLLNIFLLCRFRSFLNSQSALKGGAMVLILGCFSVLLADNVAHLARGDGWEGIRITLETVRRMFVVTLLYTLVLRLFVLLQVLEARSQAHLASRVSALQSKIKPHFFFNSLNTISELTATNPLKAEAAIDALSLIFRVSLEEGGDTHSLAKELRLCGRYLELEAWRFDVPPVVEQAVEVSEADSIEVPKLLLQPLLENAIKYGDHKNDAAGIVLSIKETTRVLSIRLSNQIAIENVEQGGHGMAIDNIKERLLVLYQDRQSVKVSQRDNEFVVQLKIPKTKHADH